MKRPLVPVADASPASRPVVWPGTGFPVVCLGGSAGSLVALEQFLRAVPPASGVAYIVVTHQLPTPDSELPQVLQHFTQLPVQPVVEGLRVRPNQVYVIPPGRDMALLNGALHLFEPSQPQGHRLPIDSFLHSLAKDARDRAICVILSGMGADGSVGLRTVMENFGLVLVQQPTEAEYDSMPQAAIATGLVDFVLPAAALPARLLAHVRQQPPPRLPRRRRRVGRRRRCAGQRAGPCSAKDFSADPRPDRPRLLAL